MGDNIISGIVTVALGVVGVATIAVILSKNSATANVLSAAGNALSTSLKAATGPISGGASGLGPAVNNFTSLIPDLSNAFN